jgi:translocation and assembly module TamA
VTLKSLIFCRRLIRGFLIALGAARLAHAAAPYEVDFTSTGSDAVDAAIAAASQLSALQDRPPDSDAGLRSRVANDRQRLDAVARSFGYYDDRVEIAIDANAQPEKVTVSVALGPQYILASAAIVAAGDRPFPPGAPTVTPAEIGLDIGKPALADPVAAANDRIERRFREKGFPFARVTQRKVVVDHGTRRMDVTYAVDPGQSALFGPTSFTGLESVHEAYVARRLRWTVGQPYDVDLVDKTRDALIASNLFSTVEITTVKAADPAIVPMAVPMAVDVSERPPRSIAAGISYASTEGVSGNASWEHRNLFGEAEDLKFGLLVGQELSAATADFRKPDIPGVGWDLLGKLTIDKETANAYTGKGGRLFGGFEYKGFKDIVLGFGLALEHANIDDYELRQHYTLVGIPFYSKRDVTDDLLNPTRGDREGVTLTPYADPARPSFSFVSARIDGSIYRRLGDDDRFVLAALGAIGATAGVGLDELPKDKRFYVGGGGSVRGYGFQRAGPIGIHDEPIGGLSSAEASLELRYRLTRTIGIVPFVDAGNVYDTALPDLSRRVFIGTGIGVRYYTSLGPLRLDLATPLHRREGDRPIEIYVSLGQAF